MCRHSHTKIHTEADGCYWVQCAHCKARGPKRNSATLAVKSAKRNIRRR